MSLYWASSTQGNALLASKEWVADEKCQKTSCVVRTAIFPSEPTFKDPRQHHLGNRLTPDRVGNDGRGDWLTKSCQMCRRSSALMTYATFCFLVQGQSVGRITYYTRSRR